jgi:methyl-accepting chemotaxis protein
MSEAAPSFENIVARSAVMAGSLGLSTLDLQVDIAELATRVTEQAETIERIGERAGHLVGDVHSVAHAADDARRNSAQARHVVTDSGRQLDAATTDVGEMIAEVSRIHDGLGTFNVALEDVARITAAINAIAGQTNLLALNATIEAARAGSAGRGFAVVAGEVKKLASETAAATRRIEESIGALAREAQEMLQRIDRGVAKAQSAQRGARDIEALVALLSSLIQNLSSNTEQVADRVGPMVAAVGHVRSGLDALSSTSIDNASGLRRLSGRVTEVSDDTNGLIQMIAESGVEIPDTPYIRFALDAGAGVVVAMENAIRRGDLSLEDAMSDKHEPIPSTDPPQFTHRAQPLLVSAFRTYQERAKALPGFFGMTLTDRFGFGAVAMPDRAHPQRPGNAAWNAEYSRQGLFHQLDTQEKRWNTAAFHLRAYRRPIAQSGVLLLKQVGVPIRVSEQYWGVLILAYESPR